MIFKFLIEKSSYRVSQKLKVKMSTCSKHVQSKIFLIPEFEQMLNIFGESILLR